MRNPSKNTIKQIMRTAKFWQDKGCYFNPRYTETDYRQYFLFNSVGAHLYIMSKGNICNRSLKGLEKYLSEIQTKPN